MDRKDRVRRQFQIADSVVKLLSGLLGIIFIVWMLYLWFFRK